jgi:hypothetical protein
MREFQVGETAIGYRYFTLPDRNGMECQIVAPLRCVCAFEVRCGAYTVKPRYLVRWADGLESMAQPQTLRPKCDGDDQAYWAMIACIRRAMEAARGGVHA